MPVLVEASLDSGPWSAPRWFTLTSDKGLKWPWCAFSIYFTLFLARDVGAFFLPVVLPSGWAWLRHVKSGYRVWLRRIIHSIAWYCNTDGDGVIAHSIVGYQRWLRRSTNSRSAHAPLQHQRSVHLFSPKLEESHALHAGLELQSHTRAALQRKRDKLRYLHVAERVAGVPQVVGEKRQLIRSRRPFDQPCMFFGEAAAPSGPQPGLSKEFKGTERR